MPTCNITYNGCIAQLAGLSSEMSDCLIDTLRCVNSQQVYTEQSNFSKLSQAELVVNATTYLFDRERSLIPTGLLARVCTLLKQYNWDVVLHPEQKFAISAIVPSQTVLPAYLRPYQVAAIESGLVSKRGVWQMPTGSGKTLTATEFIKLFPTAQILFTVPRVKLAHQTIEVLVKSLGEPIGLVGDSQLNWQRVTVGVINSLKIAARAGDPHLNQIQVVINDETHFAGSASYLELSQALTNQQYVIGLSATPTRSDGCDLIVEAVTGPRIYLVKDEEVAAIGATNLPTYIQIDIADRYLRERKSPPQLSTHPSMPEILRLYRYSIIRNHDRNQTIVDLVKQVLALPNRQGNLLVLFDYIEHGETLIAMLAKSGITAPLLHGTTPKKIGKQILADFTDNKIPLLVGSRVLKEGVDFPELQFLILAGAASTDNTHIQQIGRALRTNSQYVKQQSIVYDFNDGDFYFSRRSARRQQFAIARYGIDCAHTVTNVTSAIKITTASLA